MTVILVASVHHTGTKLVYDGILTGIENKLRIHLEPRFHRDIQECLGLATIIVPLRHPRIVARGWKFRSKSLEMLGAQWTMLKEVIEPHWPCYLPIENEDRDDWLDKVILAIGRKVDTSWPVIGRSPEPKPDLSREEEELVASWMEDGFFERFGYEM